MLFLLGGPYNVIFYILYLLGDSRISIIYNCLVVFTWQTIQCYILYLLGDNRISIIYNCLVDHTMLSLYLLEDNIL